MEILSTRRLLLREMTPEDLNDLASILEDEETMYAYEGAFTREETIAWMGRQFDRYKRDGFGLWAVILRQTGEMIGQCGITLQMIGDETFPEIGYLFRRDQWGNGYATEAAQACRRHAFKQLGIQEIYSIIRDTNIASINVAIRNGMHIRRRFVKQYRGIDMPHYLFVAMNDRAVPEQKEEYNVIFREMPAEQGVVTV